MTQCEWGSCHVSLVFPLKNAEESFPAWNGGFLLAESEYECGPRGVIMVASLCTFIVPLALSFLFLKILSINCGIPESFMQTDVH